MNVQSQVSSAATSGSVTVPALPAYVDINSNGLPDVNTSYAFIITAVGGVNVISAVAY